MCYSYYVDDVFDWDTGNEDHVLLRQFVADRVYEEEKRKGS